MQTPPHIPTSAGAVRQDQLPSPQGAAPWTLDDEALPPSALRRAAPGERAFGYELKLIWEGGKTAFSRAIKLFFGLGGKPDGLALAQQEALLRAVASCRDLGQKAGVLELHYQLAAALRLTERGGYRCQGSEVFFGHQHEIVLGEDGEPVMVAGKDGTLRPKRKYIPTGERTGERSLATRIGCSVRTLYRWWRILVVHGVWHAWRPPRTAPDALFNRSGSQVYSQRALVGGTPRCVAARLPRRDDRRARPPETGIGLPMRQDELKSAFAFIDGADYIPF